MGQRCPAQETHLGIASTVQHSTVHINTCGTTEAPVHPPALLPGPGYLRAPRRHLTGTEGLSNKHRALRGLPRATFGDHFRARSRVLYLHVSEQHPSNPPLGHSPPGSLYPLSSSPLHVTYNNNPQGGDQATSRRSHIPKISCTEPTFQLMSSLQQGTTHQAIATAMSPVCCII